MNERIKQLLNQAYDEAVPETWTTLSSEQLEKVYDKFAELIVRECVKSVTCNEALNILDRFGIDYENFGVEE